jgi:predicted negative regulator of RcsB-dependent stress response
MVNSNSFKNDNLDKLRTGNLDSNNNFNDFFNHLSIKKIVIYCIILASFFVGINYYKHHINYYNELAAQKFDTMMYAMYNNDSATVDTHGKELLMYSDRTPYPRLAAILLAKVYIEDNKFDQAIEKLELVTKRNKDQNKRDFIWHIANLRLIKVLLIQGKLEEATKYLNTGMVDKQFDSRYHELKGDLLLISNNKEAANLEYSMALQGLPSQSIAPWLDLKIADL